MKKATHKTFHPRGEPTWPEFRQAIPGETRVEHVRSGRTGTFARWPKTPPGKTNPGYAVIEWDVHNAAGRRFASNRGRVVAYAFELRAI